MSSSATLTAIFTAQDRMSNAMAGINRSGVKMQDTMRKIATAVTAAFSVKKLVDFGSEAEKTARTFEKSMAEVYTLIPDLSATAKTKMEKDVKDFAKQAGALTGEVTPALYQAISAGVPKDNVFEFLDVANKAAIGGVSSLETAVDGLSSVTNAYGSEILSVGRASDLMFTAVKLGKTTFEELAASLFNSVPTAAAAGLGFENVTAALAVMTAQGVPTSVATTQLRQALVELADSGSEVGKTFKWVTGSSFKDFIAQGNNLQDALQNMEKYAQKNKVGINELFGSVEAGNAVLALTGNGTKKFTEALAAMESSAGATATAYDTMEQTTERKLAKISAAWDVAKVEIGTKIMEASMPIIEWIAENMDEITGAIGGVFDVVSGVAGEVWGVIKPIINWIRDNPNVVSGAIKGIGTAIVTYKVISGVTNFAGALKGLLGLFSSGPVGIIAGVAAGIAGIAVAINEAYQASLDANLDEHFGNIALSMDEIHAAAEALIRDNSFGFLEEAEQSYANVDKLGQNVEDSIKTLNKLNWKVSVGLGLGEGEEETYRQAIEQSIQTAQQIIDEQQYAITMGVQFFMGDKSEGALLGVNRSFNAAREELEEIGKQLQDAVNDAFADGLLTFDETKTISELQSKMAEIADAMAQSQYYGNLAAIQGKYSGAELDQDTYKKMVEEMVAENEAYKATIDENYYKVMGEFARELDAGEITQSQYKMYTNEATKGREEKLAAADMKLNSFQLNTMSDTYGEDFKDAPQRIIDAIANQLVSGIDPEIMGTAPIFAADEADVTGVMGKKNYAAMKKMFGEGVDDTLEKYNNQIDELLAKGEAVPETLATAYGDTLMAMAMFGDSGAYEALMGLMMDDAQVEALKEKYRAIGEDIPEAIARGISMRSYLAGNAINGVGTMLASRMMGSEQMFSLPGMEQHYADNGRVSAYAGGTESALRGWAIVGEEGPELMYMAGGETVLPSDITSQILRDRAPTSSTFGGIDVRAGGEEKTIIIRLEGVGEVRVAKGASREEVERILEEAIRPAIVRAITEDIVVEGDTPHKM